MDVQVFTGAPASGRDAMAAVVVMKGDVAQIGGIDDGMQSAALVIGLCRQTAYPAAFAGGAGALVGRCAVVDRRAASSHGIFL